VTRSNYYEAMKQSARNVRARFGITGPKLTITDLNSIYEAEGLILDLWSGTFRNLRGAYFPNAQPSVMLDRSLPRDPRVFTQAHELKHHLHDRERGALMCETGNVDDMVEIGAEVFAGELLFPEAEFRARMAALGVRARACRPEDLVRLKHETDTTLSYRGLCKLAGWTGFGTEAELAKAQPKLIEVSLYGPPPRRIPRGVGISRRRFPSAG